jgi:hypothetical protein
MAYHNTPVEKQLIKLIDEFPFTEEDKKNWTETIRASGFSEELGDEIHKKLSAPTEAGAPAEHGIHSVEFARLVKQWRFSLQAKNFGRR